MHKNLTFMVNLVRPVCSFHFLSSIFSLRTGQKMKSKLNCWIYLYRGRPLWLLGCHLRAVHAFRCRKPYLDTDLSEGRPLETQGVSRWNLFLPHIGYLYFLKKLLEKNSCNRCCYKTITWHNLGCLALFNMSARFALHCWHSAIRPFIISHSMKGYYPVLGTYSNMVGLCNNVLPIVLSMLGLFCITVIIFRSTPAPR